MNQYERTGADLGYPVGWGVWGVGDDPRWARQPPTRSLVDGKVYPNDSKLFGLIILLVRKDI